MAESQGARRPARKAGCTGPRCARAWTNCGGERAGPVTNACSDLAGGRNAEEIRAARRRAGESPHGAGVIDPRQAELLLLRSHGLSYDELASALDLNPVSIGTLLSRAQHAFRKEYVKRYGQA